MRMPSDKEANKPVFDIDPAFGEMAVAMGQATWSIPNLSQREKALVCLMYDICLRDFGLPFEMHVQMALANDVPLADVHQAILFSAVDAGHPTTLGALARFKEICGKLSLEVPRESSETTSSSIDYFCDLPPLALDKDLAEMWRTPMAGFWSGGGLSAKERSYLCLVANVAQRTLDVSFAHHVHLARTNGADANALNALMRFMSEFGFSKAWAGATALARILRSESAVSRQRAS